MIAEALLNRRATDTISTRVRSPRVSTGFLPIPNESEKIVVLFEKILISSQKMKRDYIDFQSRTEPLAYLITFRCYGTWLHGDERSSVNRRSNNIPGTPKRKPNEALERAEKSLLKNKAVRLNGRMRTTVEAAIREVCDFRDYKLLALNVRTNHVHIVLGAGRKPEFLMNSMKSYCTRKLKREGQVPYDMKIWSRHGSTRYLWTDRHIEIAVEYVLDGQGGELPDFD